MKRKFLAWLLTFAMVFNMALPYTAFAEDMVIDTDGSYSVGETDTNNDNDATDDVDGDTSTADVPTTDDEQEPAVDEPAADGDDDAESDGKEVSEPAQDEPAAAVPMMAGLSLGEPMPVADAPAASYLSKLEFKYIGSTYTNVTPDASGVYNVTVPANIESSSSRTKVAPRLTLSDAAPAESTITMQYTNTKNVLVNKTVSAGSEIRLQNVIDRNMLGNTVTFTIGKGEDTQTVSMKITRTVVMDIKSVTAGDGSSIVLHDGKYLLPEDKTTIKVTADTYSADLYINGSKSTDGVVTPTWAADDTFVIKVKAVYGEQATAEQTITIKKLKDTDTFSGSCGDTATWSYAVNTKTLSIAGTGAMTDYTDGATPWNAFLPSIEKVTVAEGITSIGNYALSGAAKMTNVTLPNNLATIGSNAFAGTSALSTITLPESVTSIGDYAFNPSGLTSIALPAVENIGFCAFNGTALKSVEIPASVKTLGERAFANCKSLTDVTINGKLSKYIFSDCIQLKNVTFKGTSLKEIPQYVFANCASLKTLVLPEGVESFAVQISAVSTDFAPTSITLPTTYKGTDFTVFGKKVENITITAGNPNFEQVGDVIYGKTDGAKTSVVKCNKAAKGEITVADGVKSISTSAFANCGEITKVVLPAGLETIGENAFKNCSKLESLTLPTGLKKLNSYLISYAAVKQIEIPAGITELPVSLFSGANKLESVILPADLTTINKTVFYNCSALKTINFRGTLEQWNAVTGIGKPAEGTYVVVCNYGRADIAAVATQPVDRFFVIGDNSDKGLSVTITKPEGATVDMKWYVNDTMSTTGATAVTTTLSEDGLTAYCAPDTSAVADKYYYCEITTKLTGGDVKNMTRYAKVVVEQERWNGEGTEAKPFEIADINGLKSLADYVKAGRDTAGKYYKLTANIEIPADWTQIGTEIGTDTENYTDTYCFAGVLDGNGKKITYAEGAKSLFKYIGNVTIKDLDFEGKWINGNGLADGCVTATNWDNLVITNCKLLSGSATKGSGFVGNTAGASFTNCVVENNVKIGVNQDGTSAAVTKIGSFVGTGWYSIISCNSAATVYGEDYVGGLCGYNGYSMRGNTVKNSTFSGKVIATGEYVGGILGGGYDSYSGPNSIGAQIINCAVMADITGARAVGGILGGEGGVDQAWDSSVGNIKNNMFYGSLTLVPKTFEAWNYSSAHSCPAANIDGSKGGIVGFMRSLNKYNFVENNYFYDTNGTTKGIGAVEHIDTSAIAQMGMGADGVYYYNTSRDKLSDIKEFVDGEDKTVRPGNWQSYTSVIKNGHNRTDDPMGKDADKLVKGVTAEQMKDSAVVLKALNEGKSSMNNWVLADGAVCPTISADPVPYQLEIGGKYKTEYYIGETLDMSGATFTVTLTDGTTKTVQADEVTFTGFDSSKRALITVTAAYQSASTTFEVKVLKQGSGSSGTTTPDTIKVYFKLLGDYHHEHEDDPTLIHTFKKGNLELWLDKEAYTVDLNATVADLLKAVENKHSNVSFSNPKGNWVDAVTFDGNTMMQLDNTDNSGWQYNVNMKHTELLVNEYFLENGDSVIFYWTDDYTQDMGSEGYDNSGNQLGGGGGSSATTKEDEKTEQKPTVSTTVTPEVKADKNGEAKADVKADTIKDAISDAKTDKADEIVIAPKVDGDASKVTVTIPASSANAVAKDANADLKVKTDIADIKISSDDLSKLGASGNLTVSAEKKSDGTVDVKVTANGKDVILSKGSVSVEKKSAAANDVLVIVKADGTEEVIKKSVSDKDGITAVIDGSCTVKVVSKEVDFNDTAKHWSKEAAEFVAAREIFNGTGAKTFAPNDKMDRQMVATVLWRLENEVKGTSANKFNDEVAGWAKEAVVWAAGKQIVNGDENGNFNGSDSVSRQELAAMLYRYAKSVGMDTTASGALSKFTDNSKVADWATEAMKWAVGSGLMKGNEDGTINPNGTATRAEVATVVMRLVEKSVR